MSKRSRRKPKDDGARARVRPERASRAKNRDLPGMEDRAIKPLEEVAEAYAGIRDERMDLTRREHELKANALRLMKKYDKTVYRHDGIEMLVISGEDDIKVRVRKEEDARDDDPIGGDAEPLTDAERDGLEFSDERRRAVEGDEDAQSSTGE